MTTRQVSLEVNGKMILDADVSKAEAKVKQFADTKKVLTKLGSAPMMPPRGFPGLR